MKTKWGSRNPGSRSIRLNTDLAKKPRECLEYIVVHEMAHLLVRKHDDRFGAVMDGCLPNSRVPMPLMTPIGRRLRAACGPVHRGNQKNFPFPGQALSKHDAGNFLDTLHQVH